VDYLERLFSKVFLSSRFSNPKNEQFKPWLYNDTFKI
jgi:hypothetical protein